MQCPVCAGTQLVMSDRQGIEIDYCPQCRGVWLDRGELDKIIDRSTAAAPEPAPRQPAPPPYNNAPPYPQDPRQGYYKNDQRYRKKKGFLGELFDFD
jgi:Zn-finger nucleic acid-binding protein